MDRFEFHLALDEIWNIVRRSNKYIDETTPWVLAKDESCKQRLDTVMHNLAEALRVVSILIYPFMHVTSDAMRTQLGLPTGDPCWEDTAVFDMLGGQKVEKTGLLFPRLDVKAEIEALEAIKEANMKAAQEAGGAEQAPAEEEAYEPYKETIEFSDFEKLDLRTGVITAAEKHPKADKLLVFQVDFGCETRQIISGVAASYKPEDCVGQKVIAVMNLAPRKLRGLESNGMILFGCGADGKHTFASADCKPGTVVG